MILRFLFFFGQLLLFIELRWYSSTSQKSARRKTSSQATDSTRYGCWLDKADLNIGYWGIWNR